ncbi:alcohol dehydrogenase catalytic domain-containing protein [Alkalibacter rhizosphaerae]|uniref:Alcohol dehydrogenase catalytic domain-containing protein n=1 Tax=Alkalibacter rhizosphaerae TaxID=2815577 RepID=A0A974XDS6_9FIRM|nr:alcohol dehydrogenase catalytic domain-containing protein [Alkalibacter rhizosphaerae]QSX07871.1 alcohol dehydrogenase catalytic domain-containing protein [Alkalibacter rhizosphaerae]
MKVVSAIKIGSLKDPDESKRGKVGILDMPMQEMGPEDVRIKVAYCAICGSDPHLVEGIFGWEAPFGMGHELSGVIMEVGEKATKKGLKVGDRVAGNFLRFCGTCYYCQNGQQQFCLHADESNNPGMAETVVWHESQVYKLPDEVSLRQGCMMEPVSVAVRMMDKVRPRFGDRILISGGGPIGLLGLQALKMFGATSLTLVEPIAERRELALKYGADHVIDPMSQDVYEEAMKISEGLGFDAVVDCSGSVHAVEVLPKITAKGGTLLYGAMYPNDYEMPLNLYQYCYANELTISGYYVSPYTFPRAKQMLTRFDLDALTAKVFFIDDAEAAFEAQVSGKYPKILIQCNPDLE